MTRYRLVENGIELVEERSSTFIPADVTSHQWRAFLAWQAQGHSPEPPLARPFTTAPREVKKLWIVGAGGFGREVFSMLPTVRGFGVDWSVAGFLNDLPNALDGFTGFPPICGGTDYVPQPDDLFFCAIGDITGREQVVSRLRARGAKFINLIQPNTLISGSAHFGEGIIVEGFSGIGANTRIGDFSSILGHVNIAHDVVLGPYVQVSPFACLLGRVEVGEGTLIGSHAVVLPEVKIGPRAIVGAGAIVLKDVPEGQTVFGVPAVRLK